MSKVLRGDEGSEAQQAQLEVQVLWGSRASKVKGALMASRDLQVRQ